MKWTLGERFIEWDTAIFSSSRKWPLSFTRLAFSLLIQCSHSATIVTTERKGNDDGKDTQPDECSPW